MKKINLFLYFICIYNILFSHDVIGEQKFNLIQEQLYKQIISETRCMVCQNQNLAESEAPLAIDLKNKIKEMVEEGKSEKEIKNFLVERYSSYILYKPPFSHQNIILWLGPLIFLIILSYFLYRNIYLRK
ncbi:MAG: cytochrome c-type biogenesis protein CcmH [Gammaproteobacteria bacterium]|nr:cytochrome c-type biogenesis protein CcmH [Gammaproteobacteria bacterium]|tara:strand:+ start:180142 stop:180531 length:390 start_codon:yes stop_codon:yes gene_type:complete